MTSGAARAGVANDPSGPAPYVPVDGRPFRLAMGLRPLDLSRWLEFGGGAREQIELKAALLARSRDAVVVASDGARGACAELREEIVANLGRFHPTEPRVFDPGEHPLVAASQLVPEDLCVLERDGESWRLVAAVVCFPSRWPLGEKFGATLGEIHGPVPGYAESLGLAVTQFFDRLTPARAFWRLNWTLLDDPALFQPRPGRAATAVDPAALTFRVERQTLRRLPESAAVVFTIRTYVAPAGVVAGTHDDFATAVHTALLTAPPGSLAYKGWTGLAARWAERFGLT